MIYRGVAPHALPLTPHRFRMYILLIGYLYVIVMISAVTGASNLPLGLFFFVVLGVLPTWLIFWLTRSKQRKKASLQAETKTD